LPDELASGLSQQQFIDLLAFYSTEPFGDEWRQTASISQWLNALVNVNCNSTKKIPPIEHYMPIIHEEEETTADDLFKDCLNVFLAQGIQIDGNII
jgi:hypothetical protein